MKRHFLIPFWLFIALASACHRQPAPISEKTPLTVSISTNKIRIGDLIHLQLTSLHSTNLHLNPPDLARDKEIKVRNQQEFSEKLPDGRVRTTVNYTITSLVTGNHVIATSPGIVWTRPDGTTNQAPFPFIAFNVQSMLTGTNADLSQLRDIHALAHWPNRIPRWLLALMISAIVVGLGAWLLRRYLVRARAMAEQTPPIPPDEVALLALKMLLEKDWIEKENFRPFYWELTDILRYYVENRFGIHAPERTTEEFLAEATTSKFLDNDSQKLLFTILENADAVKFAKYHPQQPDMREAHRLAVKFVQDSIKEESLQTPEPLAYRPANGEPSK